MADPALAPPPATLPQISKVTITELLAALSAGWYDFKAAPAFGVFFSLIYVLGGAALVTFNAGTLSRTMVMSLGFPLLAPFAAVGLYEVSRRLEAAKPLAWLAILAVIFAQKNRPLPWIGAIMVLYFLAWTLAAQVIFALFAGPGSGLDANASYQAFLSGRGLALIAAELLVGGVMAFALFSLTVFSLPLLLDREIDAISAIRLSQRAVRRNPVTMLIWAAIIATLLFLAMLPMFLGLFIALPVVGHASWHLYRRALYDVL